MKLTPAPVGKGVRVINKDGRASVMFDQALAVQLRDAGKPAFMWASWRPVRGWTINKQRGFAPQQEW